MGLSYLPRSPMRKISGVFCSLLFGLTTSVAAQQPAPAPVPPPATTTFDIAALTPDQDGQLAAWFAGMEKWQKYDEKWRNRPVHDYWERIVERKPPPAPPAWLPGHCQSIAAARMTGFDDRVDYACRLVDDARARPDRPPAPRPSPRRSQGTAPSSPASISMACGPPRRTGPASTASSARTSAWWTWDGCRYSVRPASCC